jgi:hypothetical protein
MDIKIKIKDVRIAFANGVFTAKKNDSGVDQYSCTFLFPPNHPAKVELDAAVNAVGAETFGKEWASIKKQKIAKDKLVVHDGDLKTKYDGFEGNLYVIAYNKVRPDVRGRDASVIAEADGKLYSGCYVDAVLSISAYESKSYGAMLSVTLLGVQLRRDGEAFSGGAPRPDESDFEVITEGADAEDLV